MLVLNSVPSQDLDGNNERIAHQIRIHHTVENVNRAIVRSTGHEGVPVMEFNGPHGTLVVFERLVRCRRQIQIKPHHSAIETPDN